MNKRLSKFGIYTAALLMMGAIGISSSLSVIGEHFSDVSQTMITSLISVPCLVVIPVTILSGYLMDFFSKKILLLLGILFFLVGGVLPAFLDSFPAILALRAVFGIGVGLIQSLTSALIAELFEGPEKASVQGTATSAQMIGCIIMSLLGGQLGSISWEKVFFVHLLAILSLICVIVFVPHTLPEKRKKNTADAASRSGRLTPMAWFWAIACMLYFIVGQVYSNFLSFLVTEKGIGNTAQSGNSLAFFALGGFLMGLVFGKLLIALKKLTLAFGFLILAVAYLIIAFSNSLPLIFIGSILTGISISAAMACIMVEAGNSVPGPLSGKAVAIATCFQNIGMFLSPYIITPAGNLISGGTAPNFGAFLMSFIILLIFTVFAAVWGIRQNRRTA